MERRVKDIGPPAGLPNRRGMFDRFISRYRNNLVVNMRDEIDQFNKVNTDWEFFRCLYRECEAGSVDWREAFEIALMYLAEGRRDE